MSILSTTRRTRECIELSMLKRIRRCVCWRLGSSVLNRGATLSRRDLHLMNWHWITIVFGPGGLGSIQVRVLQ